MARSGLRRSVSPLVILATVVLRIDILQHACFDSPSRLASNTVSKAKETRLLARARCHKLRVCRRSLGRTSSADSYYWLCCSCFWWPGFFSFLQVGSLTF
jgi:hypothetical protein